MGQAVAREATWTHEAKKERGKLISAVTERKGILAKILEAGGWLLASLLIARAGIGYMVLPFGVALCAALPSKLPGIAALIGVLLGFATVPSEGVGLRFIACAVITAGVQKALCMMEMEEEMRWLAPATAGAVCIATGIASFIGAGVTGIQVLLLVCEGILATGFALFAEIAQQITSWKELQSEEIRKKIAAAFCGFVLLMGIATIQPGGFSIGRFIASLILLIAAERGTLSGLIVGSVAAVAVALPTPESAWFMPIAFAVAGLLAGKIARFGRFASAIALFGVAGGASLLCGGKNALTMLIELSLAILVFFFLPGWKKNEMEENELELEEDAPMILTMERKKKPIEQEISVFSLPSEEGIRLANNLNRLSVTLKSLAGDIEKRQAPVTCREAALSLQTAAGQICKRCGLSGFCWKAGEGPAAEVFAGLAPVLTEKGKLCLTDLPEVFGGKCAKRDELVKAVNHEYEKRNHSVAEKSEEAFSRAMLQQQYRTMSAAMEGLADSLNRQNEEYPKLENRIWEKMLDEEFPVEDVRVGQAEGGGLIIYLGIAKSLSVQDAEEIQKICEETASSCKEGKRISFSHPLCIKEKGKRIYTLTEQRLLNFSISRASATKEGESCSGDADRQFVTPDGRQIIVISDGMGSGEQARAESSFAVDTFERLTSCGTPRECALRMINTALLLRDSDCFATCDVCVMDPYSGEGEFLKAGAAPSFILREGKVYRIESSTLPGGILMGAELERARCTLQEGDVLIVISDGVLSSGEEDDWLHNLLLNYKEEQGELASLVLAQAAEKCEKGHGDDMTCYAVKVSTFSKE